ncbi:CapA family protein [Ornithinimicrobium faecis]|uniref:CapA family protein n=1 Tax=Ornithinimicrobium faecis TaxID=2934158 RepID=UPI002119B408|nr:CapA family protein [Ornithinimicrobium sp. HY1745]
MPTRTGLLSLTAVVGLVIAGCSGGVQPAAEGTDPPAQPTTEHPSTEQPTTAEPTRDAAVSTTATPESEAPAEVSIAFVGDVMLGRSIGERILAGRDPFAGVAAELAAADLVVGTLETTVGEGGEPEDKAFTFQAPPESIDTLLGAGFDLVALANNHSYDYGADGILGTLDLLDEAGLSHVGAGTDADAARAPVVLTAGGVETAFLSYVDVPDDWTGYRNRDWAVTSNSPGVAWAEPADIAADVAAAAADSDHVVVLLHAGTEGSHQPGEVQRTAADAALAAGATAVIGGHPHVLQGHRLEDGQLTAWSLGNFVFDGFGDDPDASRSVILGLTLDDEGITDLTWTRVAIVDGLPQVVDPQTPDGRAVLERVEADVARQD